MPSGKPVPTSRPVRRWAFLLGILALAGLIYYNNRDSLHTARPVPVQDPTPVQTSPPRPPAMEFSAPKTVKTPVSEIQQDGVIYAYLGPVTFPTKSADKTSIQVGIRLTYTDAKVGWEIKEKKDDILKVLGFLLSESTPAQIQREKTMARFTKKMSALVQSGPLKNIEWTHFSVVPEVIK